MIARFLEYIAVEKKYSDKTVRAYGDDLRDFCSYLKIDIGDFNPILISESDVKLWMIHLLDEQHFSPRSVKRKLSSLRSFYRFLLRNKVVSKDVTRLIISPKADKPLPVFFKPSEMRLATQNDAKADDFFSVRNCLIVEMLYQTGMRQAEMLGLRDVDVDTRAATVRVFGKRKKERIIPVGESLINQITIYRQFRSELGVQEAFFVHADRQGNVRPLSKTILYNIVRAHMGEVSTLKKHSPHVLRHTFATSMLDAGADIRVIKELMGHASLAATEVYTHTTFEQIKRTYNNAHPRALKRKE